jgi:hypothetical protein
MVLLHLCLHLLQLQLFQSQSQLRQLQLFQSQSQLRQLQLLLRPHLSHLLRLRNLAQVR